MFKRSDDRRKVLGTTRRVREERWVRSAATEVVAKRLAKSEISGYEDNRLVMLMAKMGKWKVDKSRK